MMDRIANHARRHGTWVEAHPLLAAVAYVSGLALLSIALIDRPLALWLKADLSPDTFGFFKTITDIGLAGPWFGLALGAWLISLSIAGLALTTTGHERWRLRARSWFYMVASMAVAGVAVQILKLIFGRLRPRYLFEDGLYAFAPFSTNNSFPSGHSQAIWSAMIALWFIYPRYRAAYVFIAVMVSVSRVATTVHYLSDWMVGSVLGIVIAILVKQWFEREGRPPVRLS